MPTQERARELFDYDELTGALTRKVCDRCHSENVPARAKTRAGYLVATVDGSKVLVHRLIWIWRFGSLAPEQYIDHINGIRTDNRIANLRVVSNQENQMNQRIRKDNKSGTTGVHWIKDKAQWEARICLRGKTITLCRTQDKNEAIAARKEGERRYGFHPNHGTRLVA